MPDGGLFPGAGAVRVADLRLRLGASEPLAGVDLSLGARGTTVILGPNGAGKSLLLHCLHGLRTPSAGRIDWPDGPPRQAMVFQSPVLLRRSVRANLHFVLPRRDRPRAAALLRRVGLADKARQSARSLSGGERQRLALARALATEPELLFLDEPTASLDPPSALVIETILRDAAAAGLRIVMVTHDIGQARRLADDVVFLHRGRVAEHGPADMFFERPESGPARDFLAGRLVL